MKSRFRIEELRKKAGLTQRELAEKLGFQSTSIVTMWETGSRSPRSEVLPLLATVLQCNIGDLFQSDAAE